MYDRLLLATDGSDTAQLATERALDAAERYGAVLHALYVIEKSRGDPDHEGLDEHVGEQHHEGTAIVDDLEQQAKSQGLDVTTAIEQGVPRTTIEEYAASHDVDLVVIGSVGASGVTDKLLGTVAKYVVNEVPADVLVVRPDEHVR